MFVEQAVSNKIGRNEPCFCGSNKKYKKCCINIKSTENNTKTLVRKAQDNIASRLTKFNSKYKFIQPEDVGAIKMSEVIIDFADELLDRANNFEQYKRALTIAIIAWNVAVFDNDKRDDTIASLFDKMKIDENSTEGKDMIDIINWHVEKKDALYPDINRAIMDFEIIRVGKEDFHLNVASTLE